MKKTVTLPDGTVEVLEGTPEEIAAHERLVRERFEKSKRKPDVLKGNELEEIFERLARVERERLGAIPWWLVAQPIWITSCSQCHFAPCICPTWEWPKIYCKTGSTLSLEGTSVCPLTCSADLVYDGSTANSNQVGWPLRD